MISIGVVIHLDWDHCDHSSTFEFKLQYKIHRTVIHAKTCDIHRFLHGWGELEMSVGSL